MTNKNKMFLWGFIVLILTMILTYLYMKNNKGETFIYYLKKASDVVYKNNNEGFIYYIKKATDVINPKKKKETYIEHLTNKQGGIQLDSTFFMIGCMSMTCGCIVMTMTTLFFAFKNSS